MHDCFHFSILRFELCYLLHDLIEVLIQISWSSFGRLNILVLLFEVESLRVFQRIAEIIGELVVNLDDLLFLLLTLVETLAAWDTIRGVKLDFLIVEFFGCRHASTLLGRP